MKFASAEQPRTRHAPRGERLIVFTAGEETFAIAASAVLEIGSTDGLSGVATPLSHPEVPKVRHTLQRGTRFYYVVNACTHFHMAPSRPALILLLSQSPAAVLVNRIDHMTEVARFYPLPRAFSGEERGWYRGLALFNDRVVPVVNPAAFLSDREIVLLDAVAGAAASGIASRKQGAAQA